MAEMSKHVLGYLNNLMDKLNIPYAFMRWNTHPPDKYYFVGEYDEMAMPNLEENGMQETNVILRGFTRGDWAALEEAREKIEKAAPMTAILDGGTGIAVFYGGASVIPTGDMELKSIKINLQVQEWKVN